MAGPKVVQLHAELDNKQEVDSAVQELANAKAQKLTWEIVIKNNVVSWMPFQNYFVSDLVEQKNHFFILNIEIYWSWYMLNQ